MYTNHKNVYKNTTLIGNWQEDRILNENEDSKSDNLGSKLLKDFEKKKEKLLKPTSLSNCSTGIKYGDTIMLINISTKSPLSTDSFENIYINNNKYKMVTTSPNNLLPCLRNTFTLIPIDCNKIGKKICYGDIFYIKMNNNLCNNNEYWYLYTQLISHLLSAKKTRQQICLFTNKKNQNIKWKIEFGNSLFALENEGKVVMPNNPVTFVNLITNQLLSSDIVIQETDLGNEYQVTCNTVVGNGSYQTLKKENIGFGSQSRQLLNQNKWIIVDCNGINK